MRQAMAATTAAGWVERKKKASLEVLASFAALALGVVTLAAGPLIPGIPSESSLRDTGRYTQTHAVPEYASLNLGIRMAYFDGRAVPMDGCSDPADFCLPGLSAEEHMIPQGVAWWEAENLLLVSSYDVRHEDASVLFVLDGATGDLVASLPISIESGKPFRGHVGGIAVSDNNLYLTSGASRIGYVPLSEVRKAISSFPADGWPKDQESTITIRGEKNLKELLGGASTAYVSIQNGMLMTGNFYHKSSAFDLPADPDNGIRSLLVGFSLEGEDSSKEWENIADAAVPSAAVAFPKSIDRIQDCIIDGDHIYVSSSYGRTKESTVCAGTLQKTDPIRDAFQDTACYTVDEDSVQRLCAMPMLEGFCIRERKDENAASAKEVLMITESGSAYYQEADDKNRVNASPTDTVWRMPLSE